MFYIVYKTTNQVNGKFYIGTHKTVDLNDNYMGSGKLLQKAIQKYGLNSFTKEILYVFDNAIEMYAKEAEIVTEEFLSEENTYNLKIGGFGGFDFVNNSGLNGTLKGTHRRKELFQDQEWVKYWKSQQKLGIHNMSDEQKAKREVARKKTMLRKYGKFVVGSFSGKTHSEETKKKIGEKNSISQKGPNNSQYGTRWVHSLRSKKSKRISKGLPLPDGWVEGRKIKF